MFCFKNMTFLFFFFIGMSCSKKESDDSDSTANPSDQTSEDQTSEDQTLENQHFELNIQLKGKLVNKNNEPLSQSEDLSKIKLVCTLLHKENVFSITKILENDDFEIQISDDPFICVLVKEEIQDKAWFLLKRSDQETGIRAHDVFLRVKKSFDLGNIQTIFEEQHVFMNPSQFKDENGTSLTEVNLDQFVANFDFNFENTGHIQKMVGPWEYEALSLTVVENTEEGITLKKDDSFSFIYSFAKQEFPLGVKMTQIGDKAHFLAKWKKDFDPNLCGQVDGLQGNIFHTGGLDFSESQPPHGKYVWSDQIKVDGQLIELSDLPLGKNQENLKIGIPGFTDECLQENEYNLSCVYNKYVDLAGKDFTHCLPELHNYFSYLSFDSLNDLQNHPLQRINLERYRHLRDDVVVNSRNPIGDVTIRGFSLGFQEELKDCVFSYEIKKLFLIDSGDLVDGMLEFHLDAFLADVEGMKDEGHDDDFIAQCHVALKNFTRERNGFETASLINWKKIK